MTVSLAEPGRLAALSDLGGLSPNPLISGPEGSYPRADPQGLNRYSYVLNNPLKYTDPGGDVAILLLGIPLYYWIAAGGLVAAYWSWVNRVNSHQVELPAIDLNIGRFFSGDAAQKAAPNMPKGLAEAITGDPNQGPFRTKREELLSRATDPKLKSTINQLYRRTANVGDGGTADLIRLEGRDISKGIERVRNLQKLLRTRNFNDSDREIAQELINELRSALQSRGITVR